MDMYHDRELLPLQFSRLDITDSSCFQVSLYTFVPPLGSSMMAPGLPDVALKYNITSETIIALTLVIFLLSFALAVRRVASLLFDVTHYRSKLRT